ncbi:helix-turn-helix transcriptional regulator [Methylobacterium terricola]|uniref:Helix-turn-helix transcriptional regulator n=1 Tax=Methylobacterium terricola TaxID=2583531 RepID=A0A5C4LID2_9HYPH|nr:AraC family transcriptional regulator [Methylobacterium terricola]TNC12915.1 helix-turn-helix transcriptional regulator [Methylobacterium terricola]
MSVPINAILMPKNFSSLLDGALVISTGENEFVEERRVIEPFKRGLTVAVTLDGRMSCRIDDRPAIWVEAPSVSLVLSTAAHRREQVFPPKQTFRYALVHLSVAAAQSHTGIPFDVLLARATRQGGGHAPAFLTTAADAVTRSIAAQIMVCPIQGMARDLFLLGKGLELVACAIESCLAADGPSQSGSGLSAGEVERATAARDILVQRYAEPLVVSRLAAMVGLNAKALGFAFRRLFGTGIPEFLQEYRLQLAYTLLATGEAGVAETAYRVGYTPAYFSTAFRRRFGVSPRDVR